MHVEKKHGERAPEVVAANSFLSGIPATVVCCHQVQVPSCKRPPQGHLVLLVPQGRTDHMGCGNLEVWIPAAGHSRMCSLKCFMAECVQEVLPYSSHTVVCRHVYMAGDRCHHFDLQYHVRHMHAWHVSRLVHCAAM